MQLMRLNRFLARAGAASSRRKAEDLIAAGKISVNGKVTEDLSTKVDPEFDNVTLDGKAIILPTDNVVLMLYKPAGYITSHDDPHAEQTVFDLLDTQKYPALSYVGRLDKDTTGLLLFTNDGALAQELTHPKYHVDKTYFAKVQGVPQKNDLKKLRTGVLLEDGMTAPAQVRLLKDVPGVFSQTQTTAKKAATKQALGKQATAKETAAKLTPAGECSKSSVLEITIHEGRKRQVKRMCAAIGHKVLALHRQSFGPLDLGNLALGEYRELSSSEIELLKASVKANTGVGAGAKTSASAGASISTSAAASTSASAAVSISGGSNANAKTRG